MSLEKSIKPISYFKSNAAEIFKNLEKDQQPLIITQNGEAKAVVQDIASYGAIQEFLALLKVLTQSVGNIANKKTKPVKKALADIRRKTSKNKR